MEEGEVEMNKANSAMAKVIAEKENIEKKQLELREVNINEQVKSIYLIQI